ncbi:hypothetical protein BASA50_011071 [Batrachochytrium salamandrivorans]|uniref:G-protein coupled receptors family 2 profile 2 domain-containing protein n=1 Tax=Batrachochytrium salamandrivorans TaxID=1357716 RepID=A0ABQ8EZN3_9FUNG|nr:hypothetical protein BASA62_010396 [Batrachochytrium salamandrivorans]KAH6577528.1 hypothetical protein BASA60_004010 [Batrachochytrium salamandrivorans]KAH6587879.1 hypothetical protein BASA50_011071 [Batrachochytrium salamandrivorans]KAJ1327094.1 hypothetical protein BSLG_010441 [Batrachochytrium salamandrivorans]
MSTMDTLSAEHQEILSNVTRVSASLSIIGTIGMICLRIFRPKFFVNTMGSLILALAAADGLDALGRVGGRWPISLGLNSVVCQLQAFMIQEFSPASANICFVISLTMLYIVHFNGSAKKLEMMQPYLIAMCFIVALPMSLAILVYSPSGNGANLVGDADSYCWISTDHKKYRLYFLYFEVWIAFLGALIAYGATWYRIVNLVKDLGLPGTGNKRSMLRMSTTSKGSTSAQPEKYQTALAKRMMMFVVAFLMIWSPATANRIYQFVTGENHFVLAVAQASCNSLGGFVNFIIFLVCLRGRGTSTCGNGIPMSPTSGTYSSNGLPSPVTSFNGTGSLTKFPVEFVAPSPMHVSLGSSKGTGGLVYHPHPMGPTVSYHSSTTSLTGLVVPNEEPWSQSNKDRP